MVNKKYHREITHPKYLNIKLWDKGPQSWLQKEITDMPNGLAKDMAIYIDEDFWVTQTTNHLTPKWGGGISLTIVLYFLFTKSQGSSWDVFGTIIFILCSFIALVSILYIFTMPPKEEIWNRKEGTVTFPGFMWQPNITMRFDDIKFTFSSGGANMVGGYMLRIVRPTKFGMLADVSLGLGNCYEDLSLYTWYMDRNRPLPPGSLFDPFREKDYRRRKAEGSPEPLYESHISIPEYIPPEI